MGDLVGTFDTVGSAVVGEGVGLGEIVGEGVPPGRIETSPQLKNSESR